MGKLTLEQFRETGRNVLLAESREPELYADLKFGRQYEVGAIALLENGAWLLVIANGQNVDYDVRNLEIILYEEFYLLES